MNRITLMPLFACVDLPNYGVTRCPAYISYVLAGSSAGVSVYSAECFVYYRRRWISSVSYYVFRAMIVVAVLWLTRLMVFRGCVKSWTKPSYR